MGAGDGEGSGSGEGAGLAGPLPGQPLEALAGGAPVSGGVAGAAAGGGGGGGGAVCGCAVVLDQGGAGGGPAALSGHRMTGPLLLGPMVLRRVNGGKKGWGKRITSFLRIP